MKKLRLFFLVLLGIFLLWGCNPELDKGSKYERPDWLAGKVYTQLLAQPELSTFASCVERSGYDTIIDVSGTYTVFAPTNEAFTAWFSEHPTYNNVEDIPMDELRELVRFHLLVDPWSKDQLQTLDVWGWIDTLDVNNDKPRGYKRETLLKRENRKLGVTYNEWDKAEQIVDTLASPWYRMYFTDSRKFAPIFYQDYFSIYNLSSDDYSFYFNRSIESPDDLYVGSAKLGDEEIFAENGFVYYVDRVLSPMKNAYEILESKEGEESYKLFLDLVNRFPEFEYNENETFNQPGATEGLAVDSLFELTYPELAFDILNEKTTAPRGTYGMPSEVTIRFHHGMAAPNDASFTALLDKYLTGVGGWGSLEESPLHIKRIIANTHLSGNPIYPTDFDLGFINGEDDRVFVDPSTIVQKEFGSNATFIGLNEAIVPRAFSSVTGPVYQQRGLSFSMFAIEQAGLLAALKRRDEQYMLFVEYDRDCQADSSLFYNYQTESFYNFEGEGRFVVRNDLSTGDLRTLILNQTGVRNPIGAARKEFIPNLAGNYLVVNNVTGEVSGTAPTSKGFKGNIIEPEFPTLIKDADNGNTFRVQNWFSFSSANLYLVLKREYPRFGELLDSTGLGDSKLNQLSFISENENYTVFAPTDSALAAAEVDTLELDQLRDLLMLHFVQGEMIFTDASSSPGYYETARIDESSTEFSIVFTSIYIDPGLDAITLAGNDGNPYLLIEEDGDKTNQMVGSDRGEGDELFSVIVTNRVIHEIDSVLQIDQLDSK